MAESSKRTHQSSTARQLMYSNPPSGAGPTCSEDTEKCVTSKRDQKIRNCLYVTRKYSNQVITTSAIKDLMKACDKDVQDIAVCHIKKKYYGKVVFSNKEKAKAALAAATSSTKDYDVRYWRKSDEINDKMEASPSVGKPVMTEKRPSTSRLLEDSTFEEQFPCSEEIEAYLIHHLHVASFDSLWESIRPVEVFVKENHLTLRGTLQDKEMAIQKVYEHPLLKDTLVTFVPSLKSQDQEKINKTLSKRYSSSTFLLKTTKCDSKFLLCSTNPAELLEAQEFLENMVPQTRTFKISKAVQVDKTKLNALLASLKDSYVDVSVNLPEQVEIRALCGEDIVSTWTDIQQCFQVVSETVVVRSEQLEKWQKNFEDKATTLSCHIAVSIMPHNIDAYNSIAITGNFKENVKELVDYVTSKCIVKQKVIFKDFCAGSIMSKTQVKQWKKHGQSKNVTVSQTKEDLGFLVVGKPLEVDDVVSSILKKYDCMLNSGKHISHGQLVLKSLYQPVCTRKKVSNWTNQMASKFMGECIFNFASNDHLKDDCISKAFLRVRKDHVVAICIVNNNLSVEKTDAIVLPTDRYCEGNSYPVQLPSLKVETFSCLMNNEMLQETGSVEMLDDEYLPCTRLVHIVYPETDLNNGGIPDFIQKSLSFAADMNVGSISFPDVSSKMISPLIDSLISLHSPTIHTVRLAVSDKNQVKCYAKVLESKVSSSLTSSDKDKETNNSYLWMWKDDNGVAVAYDLVSTDLLNQAYKKDPLGICDLQIGHQYYKIDLRTMKQCNICSLFEREVTKSFSKRVTKSLITWKYLDDSGNFSAYLPKDSVQIEAMFQKRISSAMLDINSRKYCIDFTAMLQVNVETRYSRKINRVVPRLTGNSTKPEFLCKNEVIVNFRSPSEHFQALKAYIHKGLNELIISDDISLPFDHLPDYIEAIINKHPMVDCEITTAGPITQGKRSVLRVRGLQEHVQKAQNALQKTIINAFSPNSLPFSPQKETQYPQLWDAMSTGEDCKIVTLASTSDEYAQVFEKFSETLVQYKVLDILRVQNKWIWERYAMTKSRMTEKNCGRINELELFHGSRTTPAEHICKSEEGFDMRFSREGFWGQANYFAKDSRYSDSYAHMYKGVKEMMLAQVLTGDSYECKSDRSLRMPPLKKANETDHSKVLHRYDSVCGVTCNCKVYMTYCNENAYPAYIIQYAAATDGHVSNQQHRASNHKRMQATSTNVQHGRNVPLQASAQPSKTTNLAQGHPNTSSQSNTATNLAQGQSKTSNTATNGQYSYTSNQLPPQQRRLRPSSLSQPYATTNGQNSYTSNQFPPQQQGLQPEGVYYSNYSFSSASNPQATHEVPMPSTLPAQQSYTTRGQSIWTTTDECVGGANKVPNTTQQSSCIIS